jgi:UDP-N-acetylglucosamine 1-carboxyvinyltransferase
MSQDAFEVTGGRRLSGEIVPQGAKNEALQVMCAVLLTEEKVVISNIPAIEDVHRLLHLLEGLGVAVEKLTENTYSFQASSIDLDFIHSEEFHRNAGRIRGSVMLIAPLLARFGKAFLPRPGGDKIGRRRLDTHFHGLEQLGANFKYDAERDIYYVETPQLRGASMLMDEISVTGTANVVMGAVLAKGETQIYNAACEPYVQQLCKMLNQMGAKISGIGYWILAKIDRDCPIGKKLDNLCPKLLHFLMRQYANAPTKPAATPPANAPPRSIWGTITCLTAQKTGLLTAALPSCIS